LTQSHAASRLGISQNRLSELEKEPAHLSVDRLLALTGILGLALTVLDQAKDSSTTSEW
jgi:HTH-type transcriptional regulator/antitoxin HipB